MKKKIYFLAPKNEWWTYFYYKEISEYFIKNHSELYEVYFCHSLKDYIKLHFIKADIIFSIIPFFFQPMGAKKYFFNLHGNYKIERKNSWLWVKLLYLTELNLWFSDKIILTSYFLADKLNFREKYNNKIEILPNFVGEIEEKNKQLTEDNLHFLTITSFKFYNKWKWIINLWKVIKKIWEYYHNKEIVFTIVGADKSDNFIQIKKEFDAIVFSQNIKIIFKWWLNKDEIKNEFLTHNTFLYWTYLDNYPGVILEAIQYNLRVFTNNFESFGYFLDKNIICKSEEEMFHKILKKDYENTTKIYTIKDILETITHILEWKKTY